MEIPVRFRAALRAELDALTRGDRPGLLTWVARHGADGAVLARQPEEIWTHPDSEIQLRADGTGWGVVPLWTSSENPSDLSAEFEVHRDGRIEIHDVRVL